jgi:hypothetical protein
MERATEMNGYTNTTMIPSAFSLFLLRELPFSRFDFPAGRRGGALTHCLCQY